MLIIPAIDIRDGKCVRLLRGDYSRSKVYADDPSETAALFESQGARLIHVVDLDGAREGRLVNLKTIGKIRQRVAAAVEVGGGVRRKKDIEELLHMGINRVILGTSVIEDIGFLDTVKEFLSSLVVSADLKGKFLSTRGWLKETDLFYGDFIRDILAAGLTEAIVTDISRDGALEGPHTGLYREIADAFPALSLIASGGISCLEDVESIVKLGRKNIRGIIIGKAIYEKKIDLEQALKLAQS